MPARSISKLKWVKARPSLSACRFIPQRKPHKTKRGIHAASAVAILVSARPVMSCFHSAVASLQAGMKALTEHLWFEVPSRRGFVNITNTVEQLVAKSGVKEGLCLVNAMHI